MRRYTQKEMDTMSSLDFAKSVLQVELNGRDNFYSPVAKKLNATIAELNYMEKSKMTFSQIKAIFTAWESQNPRPANRLLAYIVFKPESWPNEGRSLASRTFSVFSDCLGFIPSTNSPAIYGRSLDLSEPSVRLDLSMASENDILKKDGWKVDYCILVGQRD